MYVRGNSRTRWCLVADCSARYVKLATLVWAITQPQPNRTACRWASGGSIPPTLLQESATFNMPSMAVGLLRCRYDTRQLFADYIGKCFEQAV